MKNIKGIFYISSKQAMVYLLVVMKKNMKNVSNNKFNVPRETLGRVKMKRVFKYEEITLYDISINNHLIFVCDGDEKKVKVESE